MRYWWVNQNQTYRHEVPGGYLWSPKRNSNGARNPFYDFMREVAPGDLIYSFSDTGIKAVGIARSHAYECPKPLEFGKAGAYWELVGWRVDVRFHELIHVIRPVEQMQVLGPLLPKKYAPLQESGQGLQGVYLTVLPAAFSDALLGLIGPEARNIANAAYVADATEPSVAVGLAAWEEHQIEEIASDISVPETTRLAVVLARRGQSLFKQNVQKIETACRITKVDRIEHLRASHCKPWRDASNAERLDGENGLLLTPAIDHLFDRGFISFESNGDLIVSPVAHPLSLQRMGVDVGQKINVGSFSQAQRGYLDFHRDNVFLEARALRGAIHS
jgi:putative restriction endonuclease